MGDVLPLCAASPGTTDSYQKGMQNLKIVVSFFKNFRWAWPSKFGGPTTGRRRLLVAVDLAWWCLGSLPFFFMFCASIELLSLLPIPISVIVVTGGLIFHVLVLMSIAYWHQHMPFRLMGANAKFMIEVIPVITAAALRHLLGFNSVHIFLLLSYSTYFCICAHLFHVAYDIRLIDVLLGIVIQALVYKLNEELLVGALAVSFCLGLCFYKYMTYCAPEIPATCKKELELEQLPC